MELSQYIDKIRNVWLSLCFICNFIPFLLSLKYNIKTTDGTLDDLLFHSNHVRHYIYQQFLCVFSLSTGLCTAYTPTIFIDYVRLKSCEIKTNIL